MHCTHDQNQSQATKSVEPNTGRSGSRINADKGTQITVLITPKGVATKRFEATPEGFKEHSFNLPKYLDAIVEHLPDLDAFHKLLTKMQRDPKASFALGAPTEHAQSKADSSGWMRRFRRNKSSKQNKYRKPDPPHLQEANTRLIIVDRDSVEIPNDLNFRDPDQVLAACLKDLQDNLPPEFRGGSCIIQLSSSAGLKRIDKGIKLAYHAFFWSDRPVALASLRNYFEKKAPGVDRAIYHAVQPIYTSAPIIEGGADPVSQRIFWIEGEGHKKEITLPACVEDLQQLNIRIEREEAERTKLRKQHTRLSRLLHSGKKDIPSCVAYSQKLASKELEGLVEQVSGAAPGERNDTLNRASYRAGRLISSGLLERENAQKLLVSAGQSIGLAETEAKATCNSGLSDGLRNPVDLADYGVPPELVAPVLFAKERYMEMPEIPEKIRLIINASSLGGGKTQWLVEESKKSESCLAIAPRISLTRELHGRLGESFVHYQDQQGELRQLNVVTCLPSLRRIALDYENGLIRSIELLAFDEIEQALSQLFGDNLLKAMESGAIYEHMRLLCRAAKRVVLLDAFARPETIALFMKMMELEEDEVFVHKHEYVDPDFAVAMAPSKESFEIGVLEKLSEGKRLAIPCTSKGAARRIHKMIQKKFPELEIRVYDSDEPLDGCANELWGGLDCVIYSPTISSGVSFDPKHFDQICLCGSHVPGLCYNDFLQMTRRIRNPKNKTLFAWIEKTHRKAPTDIVRIREKKSKYAQGALGYMRVQVNDDGIVERHPVNQEHFEAWTQWIAARNRRSNAVYELLLLYWKQRNIPIEELDDLGKKQKKKQGKQGQQIKKELKKEESGAIFKSPAIPLEVAKRIERQHGATPTERRAALRARLAETFGPDVFTQEVVEECLGSKKLHKQIKRITKTAAMLTHPELMRDYLLEKDLQTARSGFDAELSSQAMLYQIVGWIIEKADQTLMPGVLPVVKGFSPYCDKTNVGDPPGGIHSLSEEESHGVDQESEEVQEDAQKQFAEYLWGLLSEEVNQEILRKGGIHLQAKNTPQSNLGIVLRWLGVERTSKRKRRKDGSCTREYSLNVGDVSRRLELSRWYRGKTLRRLEEHAENQAYLESLRKSEEIPSYSAGFDDTDDDVFFGSIGEMGSVEKVEVSGLMQRE